MDMIRLVNLSKSFKGLRAVNGIDLKVPKGRLFGFLGPNGAGKTTTIKMMAGVMKPTEGRIFIDGMDLRKEPSKVKQRVGFIPDRPFLYEKLTGLEFLRFTAALYHLHENKRLDRRIERLLELFDMSPWKEELIESYSHGMKQRLVMCSALLQSPRVYIVDEPMVGLDPRGSKLVKEIFREQAQKGATFFISTHSLEFAQDICEEIAIIQSGRIIAQGDAAALRQAAGVEGGLEGVFLKLTEEKGIVHERPLSSA